MIAAQIADLIHATKHGDRAKAPAEPGVLLNDRASGFWCRHHRPLRVRMFERGTVPGRMFEREIVPAQTRLGRSLRLIFGAAMCNRDGSSTMIVARIAHLIHATKHGDRAKAPAKPGLRWHEPTLCLLTYGWFIEANFERINTAQNKQQGNVE